MAFSPTVRARAAQLLMGGTGLGIASFAWSFGGFHWQPVAAGALVGGAGLLYGVRSVVGQIVARAASWAVLAPTGTALLFSVLGSTRPELSVVAGAVATGSALWLGRGQLHGDEAKKQFDPRVLRRWLLAASTAATTIGAYGLLVAGFDLVGFGGERAADLVLMALSSMLLGSALGIVRMRAWGALLGVVSSAFALASWPFVRDAFGPGMFIAAVPGLMVLLGVLAARAGLVEPNGKLRIGVSKSASEAPRVRVAVAEEDALDAPTDVEEPRARRVVA